MDRKVDEFYKTCEVCLKNKTRCARPIGKMGKLGPPEEPYEIMSMDTVGGFSDDKSQNRYMHILIDHFTRKAYISTSKSQTAREIIKLFDEIGKNNHIGIILADQYPAMNSREFKNYLKKRNTQLIFTAIDHPESNGMTER